MITEYKEIWRLAKAVVVFGVRKDMLKVDLSIFRSVKGIWHE